MARTGGFRFCGSVGDKGFGKEMGDSNGLKSRNMRKIEEVEGTM